MLQVPKRFRWWVRSTSFTQVAMLWHFFAFLMRQDGQGKPALRPATLQSLVPRGISASSDSPFITPVKYSAAIFISLSLFSLTKFSILVHAYRRSSALGFKKRKKTGSKSPLESNHAECLNSIWLLCFFPQEVQWEKKKINILSTPLQFLYSKSIVLIFVTPLVRAGGFHISEKRKAKSGWMNLSESWRRAESESC